MNPWMGAGLKEVRDRATILVAFIAAVRVAPYVLQYFQNDELTLDF